MGAALVFDPLRAAGCALVSEPVLRDAYLDEGLAVGRRCRRAFEDFRQNIREIQGSRVSGRHGAVRLEHESQNV